MSTSADQLIADLLVVDDNCGPWLDVNNEEVWERDGEVEECAEIKKPNQRSGATAHSLDEQEYDDDNTDALDTEDLLSVMTIRAVPLQKRESSARLRSSFHKPNGTIPFVAINIDAADVCTAYFGANGCDQANFR
ncbi:hypothetical protein HK097_009414 [Rhizophlyctis rosea]|uniref:Uncharacterized protein n=1 Tax=Rhizophlyctis rosea TaxID=64517 RepID=A0AAD5SKQ8_9FUNG|nr:hypothetical protein HK097_009414 [Rhizophlyctis rosea]